MFRSFVKSWKKFNLRQFLIFTGIALVLWFGVQLSIHQEFIFESQIELTDFPKDISLPFTSVPVEIKYEGSGFLFFSKEAQWKTINLSVHQLKDSSGSYFFSKDTLLSVLQKSTSTVADELAIEKLPDPIPYKQYFSKKIPIRANIELDFVPSFGMFEPIKLEKDSVKVIGSKESLEKTFYVETEKLFFTDISESFEGEVSLIGAKEYGHLLGFDKLKFKVNVKQFTEQKMTVPIQFSNLPEAVDFVALPNEVEVFFKVPLVEAASIKEEDFEVQADFTLVQKGLRQLPLKLIKSPEIISDSWLQPTQIDYLYNMN